MIEAVVIAGVPYAVDPPAFVCGTLTADALELYGVAANEPLV